MHLVVPSPIGSTRDFDGSVRMHVVPVYRSLYRSLELVSNVILELEHNTLDCNIKCQDSVISVKIKKMQAVGSLIPIAQRWGNAKLQQLKGRHGPEGDPAEV